jgi:hypothetical protein
MREFKNLTSIQSNIMIIMSFYSSEYSYYVV